MVAILPDKGLLLEMTYFFFLNLVPASPASPEHKRRIVVGSGTAADGFFMIASLMESIVSGRPNPSPNAFTPKMDTIVSALGGRTFTINCIEARVKDSG